MRALWIKSDFPLPADTGGKIRTRHLLFELAKRAKVTFLSYIPPNHGQQFVDELRAAGIGFESVVRAEEHKHGAGFYARVLSKIGSARPYIVNKYITPEMIAALRRWATPEHFDIVLCDFLEMAWCAEYVKNLPVALFQHNVETVIWRRYHDVETNPVKRLYFAHEKERLARFEGAACRRFDLVLTVSDADGELLKSEFGLRDYVTIPTGVDIEYFQPRDGEIRGRLVFCGSMDWMPNIDGFWWFKNSIYPLIRQSSSQVSLSVVGRRPGDDIRAEAEVDNSIIVTGTVDDVRPHVASGQIYIVPLRVGGGTRIKIYEALAMRKCVISTSIGAEGLPLVDGKHIVIADGEVAFAAAVNELLRDDKKRHTIADAGYRLVTEHYGWSQAAGILEQALAQTAQRRAAVRV